MLRKAQNYVTWGEVSKEIVETMLEKRGRLTGDKSLTVEYAQKLGWKSYAELAKAIFDGHLQYRDLPDVKPFFRLHPPSRGFKGKVRKSYGMHGEVGYRGKEINELIRRMA
jgi:large subunit ribosomal protein L30